MTPVGAAQAHSGCAATQPRAELHSLGGRWRRRREWHVCAGHRDVDELRRVGLHVLLAEAVAAAAILGQKRVSKIRVR